VLWEVHMTRPDQSTIRNEIVSFLPAEDFGLLRPSSIC
jgi:hypothetical protein